MTVLRLPACLLLSEALAVGLVLTSALQPVATASAFTARTTTATTFSVTDLRDTIKLVPLQAFPEVEEQPESTPPDGTNRDEDDDKADEPAPADHPDSRSEESADTPAPPGQPEDNALPPDQPDQPEDNAALPDQPDRPEDNAALPEDGPGLEDRAPDPDQGAAPIAPPTQSPKATDEPATPPAGADPPAVSPDEPPAPDEPTPPAAETPPGDAPQPGDGPGEAPLSPPVEAPPVGSPVAPPADVATGDVPPIDVPPTDLVPPDAPPVEPPADVFPPETPPPVEPPTPAEPPPQAAPTEPTPPEIPPLDGPRALGHHITPTASFDAEAAVLRVTGVLPGHAVTIAGGFAAVAVGVLAERGSAGWQVEVEQTGAFQLAAEGLPGTSLPDDGDFPDAFIVGVRIAIPHGTGPGVYGGQVKVSAANGWVSKVVQVVVEVIPPGLGEPDERGKTVSQGSEAEGPSGDQGRADPDLKAEPDMSGAGVPKEELKWRVGG